MTKSRYDLGLDNGLDRRLKRLILEPAGAALLGDDIHTRN